MSNVLYERTVCAFFIDLRESTKLMGGWRETSAKLHKAFLSTVTNTVSYYKGSIQDFQGDGVLVFWNADREGINNAVKSALVLKWLIREKFKPKFEKYVKDGIDFGIGIDYSSILISKIGELDQDRKNDIIFIGRSVNIAVELADRQKSPKNIAITERIHKMLEDNMKLKENANLFEKLWDGGARWSEGFLGYDVIEWKEKEIKVYTTNSSIPLE